ncbi:TIGR04255 family protein [Actinoplanes solisilvae]|uniref:TIGR04255 family protein n=1 Tax=Actinoplanes solisilvae TaxID=2486853 RepID=UPI000FDB79A6|nr:TIGR04255 family protein [Actinoplanes solisilvae]
MPLPAPDRTPLVAPPLLVTLCQVRYETRQDLDSASAAKTLLKHLKPLGLDAMTQVRQHHVVLIAAPATEPLKQEAPPQPAGWQFTSDTGTTTVNVLTDQMTLETRVYPGWEAFLSLWGHCVRALAEAANPALSTRFGLRYVNRIKSRQAREARDFGRADLVDPAFSGPIENSPLSSYVTATEGRATLRFEDGTESLVQHGVVSEGTAPAFVLDIDCFQSGAREFDQESLLAAASVLNERALQIFQTVVRPALQEEMKQGGEVP